MQVAASTCRAAEKLASGVWRNALPGPRAGFYYGHPSKALPTNSLSNNSASFWLDATKRICLPLGRQHHFRKQRGDKAKGMLSQQGLLKLFQQKAREGAWRSCVPGASHSANKKARSRQGRWLALLRLLLLPGLENCTPAPAYLCNLASKSFAFFLLFLSGLDSSPSHRNPSALASWILGSQIRTIAHG